MSDTNTSIRAMTSVLLGVYIGLSNSSKEKDIISMQRNVEAAKGGLKVVFEAMTEHCQESKIPFALYELSIKGGSLEGDKIIFLNGEEVTLQEYIPDWDCLDKKEE